MVNDYTVTMKPAYYINSPLDISNFYLVMIIYCDESLSDIQKDAITTGNDYETDYCALIPIIQFSLNRIHYYLSVVYFWILSI